jgi:hypothetical protein
MGRKRHQFVESYLRTEGCPEELPAPIAEEVPAVLESSTVLGQVRRRKAHLSLGRMVASGSSLGIVEGLIAELDERYDWFVPDMSSADRLPYVYFSSLLTLVRGESRYWKNSKAARVATVDEIMLPDQPWWEGLPRASQPIRVVTNLMALPGNRMTRKSNTRVVMAVDTREGMGPYVIEERRALVEALDPTAQLCPDGTARSRGVGVVLGRSSADGEAHTLLPGDIGRRLTLALGEISLIPEARMVGGSK